MTHDEFESIAALEALGAASAEEESALREHLQTCDSCQRARDEFAEAATLLARDLDPVPASPEARQRIMDSIETGDTAETTLVETHRHFGTPWRWWAVAAVLFLALWGWRELAIRAARERIASRDAEIGRLTAENERLAEQLARVNREMAVVASPGTKAITLTGPANASARAFVSPQGQGLVIVQNLPPTPPDKSYQLWVIRADQPKPQSAAVFDLAAPGAKTIALDHLPPQNKIKAFAVTLEAKGGVLQPTSNNFYLTGKI